MTGQMVSLLSATLILETVYDGTLTPRSAESDLDQFTRRSHSWNASAW